MLFRLRGYLVRLALVLPKECQRRRSPTPQSDIIAGVAKISDRMSGKWDHLENSDHKRLKVSDFIQTPFGHRT